MPTEGSNRPNKASISSEVLQRQVRGRSSTSSWAPVPRAASASVLIEFTLFSK